MAKHIKQQVPIIPASSVAFLKLLKKNNDRDWFAKHKDEFIKEQSYIETFADALLAELNTHDVIETPSGKKSLHRIYRDTRFSNNKTPYKSNWSGSFRRATKQRRGGYYFHIEAGNSFIAGGFWMPENETLKKIRQEIEYNTDDFKKIINDKKFKSLFGTMEEHKLKNAPKGIDPTHPDIELLKYTSYVVSSPIDNSELTSEKLNQQIIKGLKTIQPFLNFLNTAIE
jgi:uncharacterized protein (TIGR02453 family)